MELSRNITFLIKYQVLTAYNKCNGNPARFEQDYEWT